MTKFSDVLSSLRDVVADETMSKSFSEALFPVDLTKKLSSEYLEWLCRKKEIVKRETNLAYVKAGLPFRVIWGNAPAIGEEVWVFEEEIWDGGAGVGWHRTSMYGDYAGEDVGSNWWNEPVCGRCAGNPCWLPGDVPEEDLPREIEMKDWLDKRDAADREVDCLVEEEAGPEPEQKWE